MDTVIDRLEKEQLKQDLPELEIGSTLKVTLKIEEEGKERLQTFTGLLIAKKGKNTRLTMTLRRSTGNINVERIFYVHSPLITSIEIVKKAKIRRAKLYYLRDKIGKATRLKEKSM